MDDIDLEPVFGNVIQAILQVGKFKSRQIRVSSFDELDLPLDRFNQGTFRDRIKACHHHPLSTSSKAFSIPILPAESHDSGSSQSSTLPDCSGFQE